MTQNTDQPLSSASQSASQSALQPASQLALPPTSSTVAQPIAQGTSQALTNAYHQAIGAPLPEWTTRPLPERKTIEGRYCRLEPLTPAQHAEGLWQAVSSAPDGRDWTYLTVGPFAQADAFLSHLTQAAASEDPLHYVVIDKRSGLAVGSLALMRIDPKNGVMEVGHVTFTSLLQRTPLSTEAQFLLMQYAFEQLGYRRYEWKCDSLNAPSRAAAERLGFRFEGIFRQAIVYKGRSRDTAWFSILDHEWSDLRTAFERWLAPENFDAQGQQLTRLQALRELP
jgi:RimJ/RimL family protein N-acetyltransferase